MGTTNYQFRREAREGAEGKINQLGYFAENSVQIKASKFEDMPSIIAAAVANGATRVDDIQYTLNDPVPYVDRARVEAFQNAKDEAQKSVDAAGLKLGPIVSISINGADIPQVTSMQRLNYEDADMPAAKLEPFLSPGVVHVTYSVNIEYEVLQ